MKNECCESIAKRICSFVTAMAIFMSITAFSVSSDVTEWFKEVTVYNNFTRFEISENFTDGETKTFKFTPTRTANYSLSVGVGAYEGAEIYVYGMQRQFVLSKNNLQKK